MEQLSQLKEAQGDGYRAFVSSEVNKTLKLALDSNKNLLDLYKTFFSTPTSTTNILIQGADQGNEQEYLSPDDALVLIQRKGLPANDNRTIPAIPSPSAASDTAQLADKLHDQYGVGDLEDVRENRSGTEALQAPGLEGSPATRPAKRTSLPADTEEDGGFKRRGIDVEDVDILPD